MQLEEKLKKLERIVKELENGEISLDAAVELYSEGVNIAADCKSEIENAKMKIIITE